MRKKHVDRIVDHALVVLPQMNKKLMRDADFYKMDDLHPSHVQALLSLSAHKQMTMSLLGKALHIINSNLTPIVDRLIKMGYVQRERSTEDRRVILISLTDEGKKVVRQYKQYAKRYVSDAFSELDDEQLEVLADHLGGIRAILAKISD